MNCPSCAREAKPGAKFCHHCGANLFLAVEPNPPEPMEPMEIKTEEEAPAFPDTVEAPAAESETAGPVVVSAAEEVVEEAAPPPLPLAGEDAEAQVEPPPIADEEPVVSIFREDDKEKAGLEAVSPPAEPEGPEAPEVEEKAEEVKTPVAPGTVLGGRYVVAKVLDIEEGEVLYRAYDMRRCQFCGWEENAPDAVYCGDCGAALLGRKASYLLRERPPAEEEEEGKEEEGSRVLRRFVENDLLYTVLEEPKPEFLPVGLRLIVGQRSDPGLVRELDEDSLLSLTLSCNHLSRIGPMLGLYAVADGMGGHEGGEVASKLTTLTLANLLVQHIFLPELSGETCLEETIKHHLEKAVATVNDKVYLGRQKKGTDMGTTLTAALIKDDRAYLAHVGDCRAYLWGSEGFRQLTDDHSLVASMIASGMAEPEEIYTHPQRSVILRCVGDRPTVEVDIITQKLKTGDRLILCCDGLWEMIRNEGIEEVMLQETGPQAACDELVRRANQAGGEDNISVIVVQVEAVADLRSTETAT